MFHTLSELQEKEKKEKVKKKNNIKKNKGPEDNYYGKGNKAYDHYNKKTSEEINEQFEKTKNKVRLVVYQNGFILNNGQFRDRSIPENNKFMEEVEKGNIPQELIKKGITDLGILLENRKTEIYYPVNSGVTPITQITQITQINPINPININPINQFNQYNQINQNQGFDIYNYPGQYDFPYQYQNPYMIEDPYGGYTVIPRNRARTQVWHPPQTPMGTRNVRNDIFIPNTDTRSNIVRTDKHTSSVPRKDSRKNFHTFQSFKNLEFLKEEEQKMAKKAKNKNPEEKVEEKKEEEEKKKKFTAFAGSGKFVGFFDAEGLNIDKDVKNVIDAYSPVCSLSIRLFNGEIVKCDFNYTQTVRDIYNYVGRISNSCNFTLLDGFPPIPLNDFNKTIGEMKLQNSILTQRIN